MCVLILILVIVILCYVHHNCRAGKTKAISAMIISLLLPAPQTCDEMYDDILPAIPTETNVAYATTTIPTACNAAYISTADVVNFPNDAEYEIMS